MFWILILAMVAFADDPPVKAVGPTVEFVSKRFRMQEPNYFIFGFQHPDSSIRYKNQVKVLISMGFNIIDYTVDSILVPTGKDRVWFYRKAQVTMGYRQKTFWNLYDISGPIYENNYSPSLYFSYQTINTKRLLPITILTGYVHESNGEMGIKSRSWDRMYGGVSIGNLEFNQAFIQIDMWYPFGMEENPDIWKYFGIGEVTMFYKIKQISFSCAWKLITPNIELGIYAKILVPTLYLQLYLGSGENMLDYKRRHECLRIGLATIF